MAIKENLRAARKNHRGRLYIGPLLAGECDLQDTATRYADGRDFFMESRNVSQPLDVRPW